MTFNISISRTETPHLFNCLENAIAYYMSDKTLSVTEVRNKLSNDFKIHVGTFEFIDEQYFYPVQFETKEDYTYFLLRWS